VSAAHSGLAEVTATLAAAVPPEVAGCLSFEVGDGAVRALADRIVSWLRAPEAVRAATSQALVRVARERYSWEGVAAGVIAAAQGRHEELSEPV
jgi:glycosyltransferase involved in cell wall biosynthesis